VAKKKLAEVLKQKHQVELIEMCDQRNLDHTGNKGALIARLVAYEEAKAPKPEPEAEVEAE